MPLHRLSSFTYSVPNVAEVMSYYTEFGLTDNGDGSMSTVDGGRQLYVEQGPYRRITAITLGADDPDDLGRISSSLAALGVECTVEGERLRTAEPISGTRVNVVVEQRVAQPTIAPAPTNGPGRVERVNARADGIMRTERVKPRRLGHVALVSADSEATMRFFADGLDFKVSDYAGSKSSAFMRCSPDHHNVAVFSGPASFPHHSSWQVNDLDDIGRGAEDLLAADAGRQAWGFGRHYAGSNFFWYLKDPAGTFSEYYADMDQITVDDLWTPQVCEGKSGLYSWGPVPSPDFMAPSDVAEIIAAQSS
ncbi:catechol-2,3-dioxygenase [Micromonospora kangleipakensis]|uniref:Catechol-2,3-dioxygenase n=1 Tax=Micromonospora kangleipakensis TaxID=1077942 RepID=A0A4Q8BCY7_9ACTN|nr:VOC family protein [Micromonospora kangleipakensis]RZU74939.1 catechol-2,3-dioxygenase [Micromonospora kangleipakensis]